MIDPDKEQQPVARPTDRPPADKASGPPLQDAVQTLSTMIRDLEKQLERMLEINDALEKDLEKERNSRIKIDRENAQLKDRIALFEQDIASLDDLRAEINHLGQERKRMTDIIEEVSRQAAETEHECGRLEHVAERMRTERDDAIEEVHSLEAQFDHAVEVVADLKARITSFAEEREALKTQIKAITEHLESVEKERDVFRNEVDESRLALDEIRRQIAEACVSSQRYYYQQPDESK